MAERYLEGMKNVLSALETVKNKARSGVERRLMDDRIPLGVRTLGKKIYPSIQEELLDERNIVLKQDTVLAAQILTSALEIGSSEEGKGYESIEEFSKGALWGAKLIRKRTHYNSLLPLSDKIVENYTDNFLRKLGEAKNLHGHFAREGRAIQKENPVFIRKIESARKRGKFGETFAWGAVTMIELYQLKKDEQGQFER
jgi:hypothetical protein